MNHRNKKMAAVILIVGILIAGAVFVMLRGRNGNTAGTAGTAVQKAESVEILNMDILGERKEKADGREEREGETDILETEPLGEELIEKQEGEAGQQKSAVPNQADAEEQTEADSALEYAAFPAMSIISDPLSAEQIQGLFYAEPISENLAERITGKTYVENDNITLDDLRYVRILYRGFDEETHVGELVVNQRIADKIVSIFKELYDNNYQLERVVLIDDYGADDDASVEANNTSAFNYRVVEGTKKLSKHSYGLAIDVNPLYNPYVTKKTGEWGTKLEGCKPYIDRSQDFPHKIEEEDLCYQLFKKNGFTWGGDWTSVKDYQHFEYPLQ